MSTLKTSFHDKFVEWIMSFGVILWGLLVCNSPDLFTERAWYSALANFMPQIYWGIYAIVIGSTRILFLYINGTIRQSAHIRTLGAALSLPIWGGIFIGTMSLDWLSAHIAAYTMLFSLDLISLWYAAEDAKLADIKAKKLSTYDGVS